MLRRTLIQGAIAALAPSVPAAFPRVFIGPGLHAMRKPLQVGVTYVCAPGAVLEWRG